MKKSSFEAYVVEDDGSPHGFGTFLIHPCRSCGAIRRRRMPSLCMYDTEVHVEYERRTGKCRWNTRLEGLKGDKRFAECHIPLIARSPKKLISN